MLINFVQYVKLHVLVLFTVTCTLTENVDIFCTVRCCLPKHKIKFMEYCTKYVTQVSYVAHFMQLYI